MPSISTGYSWSDVEGTDQHIDSWYAGVEWSDVLVEGNSFGGAVGEAPRWDDADGNFMWEAFYSFAVSDNITITPAIFGIYDEDSS